MLRVAVCDGAPSCRERLSSYINAWAEKVRIPVLVMEFRNGEEILFEVEQSGDFAIVFTEIELDGMNGIEAARQIREQNRLTGLVFLVSSVKYLRELCQLYPAQFMEKPITGKKVYETLGRFVEERHYLREDFYFRFNHRFYMINLFEVLYFVSQGRKVKILLENGQEYVVYAKLDMIEDKLKRYKNYFVRIHQSYLVNPKQIEQYHYRMVMLRNGETLPVSRKRREELVRFHQKYIDCGKKCHKMC